MNLRAGATATGLFLGGLGISAAVAMVTAPITPRLAVAQTVDGRSIPWQAADRPAQPQSTERFARRMD